MTPKLSKRPRLNRTNVEMRPWIGLFLRERCSKYKHPMADYAMTLMEKGIVQVLSEEYTKESITRFLYVIKTTEKCDWNLLLKKED